MRCALPILLAALLPLCSCAPDETVPEMDPHAIYRAEPEYRPVDFVSPAIRGGQDGLEVVTLVLSDTQGQLLDALAPYLDLPLPISPDVAARLRSQGVRMVRMPLADLAGLETRLHPVGVRQREWIGWALDWREAFRGRALSSADVVTMDREQIRPGAGVLRLIARCWTTPIIVPGDEGPETRAVVRMEALAQHVSSAPPRSAADPGAGLDALRAPAAVFDIRNDGRTFPAFSFEAALTPGQAYLLLALPADATPRSGSEVSPLEIAGLEPVETRAPQTSAFGPRAPVPPTIGEAMLVSPSPVSDGEVRALIALIPRAPGRAQ